MGVLRDEPAQLGRALDYVDPWGPRGGIAVNAAILTIAGPVLAVAVVPLEDRWALPGTLLGRGETLAQAVARALHTVVGLDVPVRQLRTFDELDRDREGRVVTVAYMAAVPVHRLASQTVISVDDLHSVELHHREIIDLAVQTLRHEYRHLPDPYALGEEPFTLTELQELHTVIDPTTPPTDTFRRLMEPHVELSEGRREGYRGRPSRIYVRRNDPDALAVELNRAGRRNRHPRPSTTKARDLT